MLRDTEITMERERQILQCISRHITFDGIPPTVRQIGSELYISYSRVCRYINRLDKKGKIEKTSTGRIKKIKNATNVAL